MPADIDRLTTFIHDVPDFPKPGITFKALDDIAMQYSDNEAARRLNKARDKLFRTINKSRKPAA